MRMRSTFSRIFGATASMLLLSFLVLGVAFGIIAYRTNLDARTRSLHVSAERISEMTTPLMVVGILNGNASLSKYLNIVSDVSGYHILICDVTGRVLVSSEGDNMDSNFLQVGSDVIGEIMLNGEYVGVGSLGGLYATDYLSVGMPVISAFGNARGAVFVSTEVADIRAMIMRLLYILIWTGTFVLFISCVWAFYYTRRLTRPLGRVAEVSREFARGNFSARVEESGRDIEIHELAVSFNNMAASLERSEERRRDFIANISHELKTPMTSIGGYVDGILDGVITYEKQEGYLRVVSSEVKRLNRLISQMLEISRVEAAEGGEERFEIFDLCELARKVLFSQEKKINDRNLDVDVLFDRPVDVVANTDGITQVIYNLLDNAIKYSDENSTITLDISEIGGKAIFSVSDVGRPISPEETGKIFERFHKADRSRKTEGLGLGLYLVKQIMARHNEDVWCEVDGARTTMRFTLPLAEVEEKKSIRRSSDTKNSPESGDAQQ